MFEDARHDVWVYARKMWEVGLVAGSAGNVSRRAGERHIAITPTFVPYEDLTVAQIVIVELASGRPAASTSQPSYELPMHLIVYRQRPDIGAIVHTHAPFITALSVLRRPLPPVIDEMILMFGGTVEVAEYAFTGTEAVGHNALAALGDRAGVMLANHGNVCTGHDLARALHVAIAMEACAEIYAHALQLGTPQPLTEDALKAGRAMYDARNKVEGRRPPKA